MTYAVKEIFYTLQGEGAHAGRPAVFCRFAGCNLWNGRDSDRLQAVCRFCDTDFVGVDGVGGGKFADAQGLAEAILSQWPGDDQANRMVVLTGGEPLMQVDADLVDALHARGFYIAVETNGTMPPPAGIDWLCVSPKGRAPVLVQQGQELKLVYPQVEPEAQPERFTHLDFSYFSLQPLDDPHQRQNTEAAIAYCKAHPRWRLSVQTHKWLQIP